MVDIIIVKLRQVWRYQTGNLKSLFKEQTITWQKRTKRSNKVFRETKTVNWASEQHEPYLKLGSELGSPRKANGSTFTSGICQTICHWNFLCIKQNNTKQMYATKWILLYVEIVLDLTLPIIRQIQCVRRFQYEKKAQWDQLKWYQILCNFWIFLHIYIYYGNLQFLNNAVIIKTKVLHPQSLVTLVDVGYISRIGPLVLLFPKTFKLFGFQFFDFESTWRGR